MYKIKNKYIRREFINAEALLEFDGVDDQVTIGPKHWIGPGTAYSISCIFSIRSFNNSFPTLIGNWQYNIQPYGFLLYIDTSEQKLEFTVGQGGGPAFHYVSPAETIVLNRLYHTVVTVTESNYAILYINGRVAAEADLTPAGDYSQNNNVLIGKSNDIINDYYLDGHIGEVRFYRYALSESEVRMLHRNPYVLPDSLHEYCVGEYLAQRNYFKDAQNTYGFGPDALLWFDSSEQYNYAKESVSVSLGSIDPGTGDGGWTGDGVITGNSVMLTGPALFIGTRSMIRHFDHPLSYFEIGFNGYVISNGTTQLTLYLRKESDDSIVIRETINATGMYAYTVESNEVLYAEVEIIKDTPTTGNEQFNFSSFGYRNKNVAAHGIMTGWGDEELGTDVTIHRSSIHDFYTPGLEIQNPYGFELTSVSDHHIDFPDFAAQMSNSQGTVFFEIDLTTTLIGARVFTSALETDLSANEFTLLITSLFNLPGSDNSIQFILTRTLPGNALYTVEVNNFTGKKLKILGSFDTINTTHYLYVLDEFGNFYNNSLTAWPSGQTIRWDAPTFGRNELGVFQFDGIYREARFINTVFDDPVTAEAFLRNPSSHPDEIALYGALVENNQLIDESGNGNHADVSSLSLSNGIKTMEIPPIITAFSFSGEILDGLISGFGDIIGTGNYTFLLSVHYGDPDSGNVVLYALGADRNGKGGFGLEPRINNGVSPYNPDHNLRYMESFVARTGVTETSGAFLGFYKYYSPILTNTDLSGADLTIGASSTSTDVFLARLACWSRELSYSEKVILMNTNAQSHNFNSEGLEFYFLFNEGDAFIDGPDLRLRDYSGNDRHITINGLSGSSAAEKRTTFNNQLVPVDSLRGAQAASLLTEDRSSILAQEDDGRILL